MADANGFSNELPEGGVVVVAAAVVLTPLEPASSCPSVIEQELQALVRRDELPA